MSTRSTRHGRGGARWPSSETCRRCAPVLFAAAAVALALALHVVSAEAAAHAAHSGPGPAAGRMNASLGAAAQARSHLRDRAEDRRRRTRERHHAAHGTRTGHARAAAQVPFASAVEAARSSAPAPVVAGASRALQPSRPQPTPLGEIPPVITTPLLTAPAGPRLSPFTTSWPEAPLNGASLAALMLAAAVALKALALALARRRT